MSHISTYSQKATDINLFCEVARELGHKVKIANKGETLSVQQFGRNIVEGATAEVMLKDWQYPLAIMPNGEILYDHWGSKDKKMIHLGGTLQEYNHQLINGNINMTEVEAYYSTEKPNGDIVVTLQY